MQHESALATKPTPPKPNQNSCLFYFFQINATPGILESHLSAVPGTDQRCRHGHVFKVLVDFVHREREGILHQAVDRDAVVPPGAFGNGPMVPHIVKGHRGDETL